MTLSYWLLIPYVFISYIIFAGTMYHQGYLDGLGKDSHLWWDKWSRESIDEGAIIFCIFWPISLTLLFLFCIIPHYIKSLYEKGYLKGNKQKNFTKQEEEDLKLIRKLEEEYREEALKELSVEN